MKGLNTIGQDNQKYSYISRNLPHLFDHGKPIFITYRLKFTLPSEVMTELNQRKNEWFKEIMDLDDDSKKQRVKQRDVTFFLWFDELIAKSSDVPQILHRHDLTDTIVESFRYSADLHYQLLAFCIMPNHIHVLINPLIQNGGNIYSVAHITYTWKRFTANQINRILKRRGNLWQQESYDHMIRDDTELHQILEYIIENPVKAGLVSKWNEWYGTWILDSLKPTLQVEQHADAAEIL